MRVVGRACIFSAKCFNKVYLWVYTRQRCYTFDGISMTPRPVLIEPRACSRGILLRSGGSSLLLAWQCLDVRQRSYRTESPAAKGLLVCVSVQMPSQILFFYRRYPGRRAGFMSLHIHNVASIPIGTPSLAAAIRSALISTRARPSTIVRPFSLAQKNKTTETNVCGTKQTEAKVLIIRHERVKNRLILWCPVRTPH